tara:strand:- start:151 stop:411 length:261 start_codon:yes stop_codon:yes gene_type:complete
MRKSFSTAKLPTTNTPLNEGISAGNVIKYTFTWTVNLCVIHAEGKHEGRNGHPLPTKGGDKKKAERPNWVVYLTLAIYNLSMAGGI